MESFEDWICRKIGVKYSLELWESKLLELLTKALWVINQEYFKDRSKPCIEYDIGINDGSPKYRASFEHSPGMRSYKFFVFPFQTKDIALYVMCESEFDALRKALEHIYENKK